MYGLVNKAVQDLLTHDHGAEKWLQIRALAQVDDEIFISTEPYPDDITYRLVGAAAEVLGLAPGTILERLGRWWVLQTAQHGFGHLMRAGGRNLAEFLVNLPNFHTRIEMMYPGLRPPEFHCLDLEKDRLKLRYQSHRPGLAPFVTGLLLGLGEMFSTPVEIDSERVQGTAVECHLFTIRWRNPPDHEP